MQSPRSASAPEGGARPRSAEGAGVEAANLIREAIVDGRLPAGERLKEERLARDLGLSRTPVREALQLLRAEGLIEIQPNRGATVRDYTVEEIAELYGLRAVLEGYACQVAAERATPDDITRLRESVERFEALTDSSDIYDLVRENQIFHSTIVEICNQPRLHSMLRSVVELPLSYKSFLWYSEGQRHSSAESHRKIYEALAAADADAAAREMQLHSQLARDLLVERMRSAAAAAEQDQQTRRVGPLRGATT